MTELVEVHRGSYRDSVTLMQVSRAVAAEPGVDTALVGMATELNLELLRRMMFEVPGDVSANDMIVAVRALDEETLQTARHRLGAALVERPKSQGPGVGARPSPRTVGSARSHVDADLALVSTPGRHAFVDAMDALEADMSVMVFSDNVSVEHEIRLKDEAARRGLLVMGPDCGTAVVSGLGLGFANAVRPGPVGLVAASGTGAQQLMCLLDTAGVGVSHCLGVGGRDLSAAVNARSTLQALDALDADPATELIVVVSKPPAPDVAERARKHAAALGTPVLFALLGSGQEDLTAVAVKAVRAIGGTAPAWPRWLPAQPQGLRSGTLRGLFSGGTLCDEAMIIAAADLGAIYSNIPLDPTWRLPASLRAPHHTMIDFGDDDLTAGRPHPMIDSTLRLERLAEEARDPACGVVLLDVVLGYGAHLDPAAELAPAIEVACAVAATQGRNLAVVVSLTGTHQDPQDLNRQAVSLQHAGAAVFLSNAQAARHAVACLEKGLA